MYSYASVYRMIILKAKSPLVNCVLFSLMLFLLFWWEILLYSKLSSASMHISRAPSNVQDSFKNPWTLDDVQNKADNKGLLALKKNVQYFKWWTKYTATR